MPCVIGEEGDFVLGCFCRISAKNEGCGVIINQMAMI